MDEAVDGRGEVHPQQMQRLRALKSVAGLAYASRFLQLEGQERRAQEAEAAAAEEAAAKKRRTLRSKMRLATVLTTSQRAVQERRRAEAQRQRELMIERARQEAEEAAKRVESSDDENVQLDWAAFLEAGEVRHVDRHTGEPVPDEEVPYRRRLRLQGGADAWDEERQRAEAAAAAAARRRARRRRRQRGEERARRERRRKLRQLRRHQRRAAERAEEERRAKALARLRAEERADRRRAAVRRRARRFRAEREARERLRGDIARRGEARERLRRELSPGVGLPRVTAAAYFPAVGSPGSASASAECVPPPASPCVAPRGPLSLPLSPTSGMGEEAQRAELTQRLRGLRLSPVRRAPPGGLRRPRRESVAAQYDFAADYCSGEDSPPPTGLTDSSLGSSPSSGSGSDRGLGESGGESGGERLPPLPPHRRQRARTPVLLRLAERGGFRGETHAEWMRRRGRARPRRKLVYQ